jgi:predicted AAA+ superfamily ATPase
MPDYKRFLNIESILGDFSVFIFGPRQTGKTSYLLSTFPDALYIDLLDPKTFRELSSDPRRLSSIVKAHTKKTPIIIDEVQKLPSLLNGGS